MPPYYKDIDNLRGYHHDFSEFGFVIKPNGEISFDDSDTEDLLLEGATTIHQKREWEQALFQDFINVLKPLQNIALSPSCTGSHSDANLENDIPKEIIVIKKSLPASSASHESDNPTKPEIQKKLKTTKKKKKKDGNIKSNILRKILSSPGASKTSKIKHPKTLEDQFSGTAAVRASSKSILRRRPDLNVTTSDSSSRASNPTHVTSTSTSSSNRLRIKLSESTYSSSGSSTGSYSINTPTKQRITALKQGRFTKGLKTLEKKRDNASTNSTRNSNAGKSKKKKNRSNKFMKNIVFQHE